MDNPSINIKSKYCQKHNQPILFYDQNGRNPQCQVCMQENGKLITFEQIQKQYQEKIINNNKEFDLQLQQLNTLKEGILKYQENIITCLNKSIQWISDQIKSIQSQKQSMQQLDMIMNQYESIEDFTTYLKNNQKSNGQCRKQIVVNLLQDLKSKIRNIDFLEVILEEQKSLQKMEYELIQQVESKSSIYDFAIDQRTKTLIAGMRDGNIKIYDFQQGNVGTEIQSFEAHYYSVFCLYCMKNTLSLVSGAGNGSIIIWCFDKTLNSHTSIVTCIIMNLNENWLISGSNDKTIKFRKKLSDSWNLSQTVDVGGIVLALSLNENEDKLTASTQNYEILVMITQNNYEWKLVQTIEFNQYGYRLCFTIQDQFVFQPRISDYLEVYDYDETKQQFYQKTKVIVQSVQSCDQLFPCQFIKNLNILTVKHGKFVNIFKVNKGGEYQLIQSIEYEGYFLYGRMTDDGQYLITWDDGSKQIQVRKLKFKKESS